MIKGPGPDPPLSPQLSQQGGHVEQLRHLNELARLVSSTLDLDSVCQLVVRRVPELLGGERCAIVRYDEALDGFRHVALWHRGGHAPTANEAPIPAAGSVPAETLRLGSAYVANDTRGEGLAPLPRLAG